MTPALQCADRAEQPHRMVLVFAAEEAPLGPLPAPIRESASRTARLRNFKGAAGETLLLPFGGEQWLVAGLGNQGELTRPGFCEAIALAYSELSGAGAREMALMLPEGLPWPPRETARYASEALLMAGYAFRAYRSTEHNADTDASVTLVAAGQRAALAAGIEAGRHVGEGIRISRDLINHPAAVAHTDFVGDEAQRVAKSLGARFRRIRGDALVRQGYGAIHAVGRAAEHPPSLVALEYGERGPRRPTIALVGKGVTFDSGGLNLKSSAAMALMKKDMGGAAIVLGAFHAIAALGLPVHLVTVLALAENAVDSRAYRPGDVVQCKQGLRIEISNTDAEGRVVLADALALAREYRPHYLIDFATLTGACRTALGKDLMGLFCEHEALRAAVMASAEATGDHVWPLPLWTPYRKMLDSSVADLVNAATDGMAGAITGALFLKEFAGSVAWAHLDCYAWSDGDSSLFPRGGSGVGVRLCVELMTRLQDDSLEDHAHGD